MKNRILIIILLFAAYTTVQTGCAVFRSQKSNLLIRTPLKTTQASFSLSPDGNRIVYAAETEGQNELWLHSLDSGSLKLLPGTQGVEIPFSSCWSPDSRSVAFFNKGLKKVDIDTGRVQTLIKDERLEGRGCTWNNDGTILFSIYLLENQVLQISDRGGIPVPATTIGAYPKEYPHFLPDGIHFLYFEEASRQIYVDQLNNSSPKKLLVADSAAVYAEPGYLLYVLGGGLYAQSFDPAALELKGKPILVTKQVPIVMRAAAVSTSPSGTVAYFMGSGGGVRQFKWFDRTGNELDTVGEATPIELAAPELSPDGRFVALDRNMNGNIDIWILDLETGQCRRFTSDPADDFYPVWSADGKTIYFSSGRSGMNLLYEKPVDGSERAKLIMNDIQQRAPRNASRDGQFLLYSLRNTVAIMLNATPRRELPVGVNAIFPQFSPDNRWIAFQSIPRPEVYIQQFPYGQRMKVSENGGGHMRWRPDGRELFYIAPDGMLMAVPLEISASSRDIHIGKPMALFKPPIVADVLATRYAQQYIVSPDGSRFLIATSPAIQSPIKVIPNWRP